MKLTEKQKQVFIDAVKSEIISSYKNLSTPMDNADGYFVVGIVSAALSQVDLHQEPKIDLEEVEKLLYLLASEVYFAPEDQFRQDFAVSQWRKLVGYTLNDLNK